MQTKPSLRGQAQKRRIRPTKRPVIRGTTPECGESRPAEAAVDYKKMRRNFFKKKREEACRKKKKDAILTTQKKTETEELLSNLLEYRFSITSLLYRG